MGVSSNRIFIVDDDRSFGRSLKRLLNARGIPSEYFASADHFMDSVPSGQQGIAIVDIHMTGCTGFELMKKMRGMHYHMPVILISGRTEGYSRDIALQRGAVGFLQKPFNEQTLLDLIQEVEEERNQQNSMSDI